VLFLENLPNFRNLVFIYRLNRVSSFLPYRNVENSFDCSFIIRLTCFGSQLRLHNLLQHLYPRFTVPDAVRPLAIFQAQLTESGRCDICTNWTLKAGETWGLEYQEQDQDDAGREVTRRLIPVGKWSPREGLRMSDYLFPHVGHGFAGRNLPIISFHVSFSH
jgi:hypothetical protein